MASFLSAFVKGVELVSGIFSIEARGTTTFPLILQIPHNAPLDHLDRLAVVQAPFHHAYSHDPPEYDAFQQAVLAVRLLTRKGHIGAHVACVPEFELRDPDQQANDAVGYTPPPLAAGVPCSSVRKGPFCPILPRHD